jgi:hypothetical protein
MRSASGRRYRYLVASYSNELGAELTEPEKALVRQIASVQLQIEKLQAQIVRGEDVSADETIRLTSEHRRLLSALADRASQNKPAAQQSVEDLFAVADDSAEADAE